MDHKPHGAGHQHQHHAPMARENHLAPGRPGTDHTHDHRHQDHPPQGASVVVDPVCGMDVDPATAKYRAEFKGRTYYFCSGGCQAAFEANPGRYAAADVTPAAAQDVLTDLGLGSQLRRYGIVRSYLTRHGAGPLPTFDPELDRLPEAHNADDGWQGTGDWLGYERRRR